MINIHNQVLKHIQENQHELFSLLQEVVRIPSICGQEGEAQQWIGEKYRSIGLDVKMFEADYNKVSKHSAFIDSGFPFIKRPNVVGILKGNSKFKSLTLNGHIDVVSSEPLDSWKFDPYGGQIESGKLYGRGALDMKGGLIANYFALCTLLRLDIKPKGTVMLQSVVEEEAGGGGGTLACMLEGYRTDGFLVSEPHNLNVTISHAGVLYFKIKVKGKTSHGGLAHLGINAIDKIIPIYLSLKDLDEERCSKIHYDLFDSGSGRSVHLNFGTLKAGDWPSTVAGWAQLECRISFIPGERMMDIKKLVEEVVFDAASKDHWLVENPPVIEWFGWKTDPWYQDPNHLYVKSFINTAEKVLKKQVNIIGRASGNDARFTQHFNNAGICFGPSGDNMHGVDEYIDLESFVKTTQVIAIHIMDWCKFH